MLLRTEDDLRVEKCLPRFGKDKEWWLFDVSEDKPVTASEFKQHILQSLKNVFGEIGSCMNIDVLRYESDKKSAILRCWSSDYVKLRSALTLAGVYKGHSCVYVVNNSSPLLISLLSNSRQYVHK